jgi:hypothetical protein
MHLNTTITIPQQYTRQCPCGATPSTPTACAASATPAWSGDVADQVPHATRPGAGEAVNPGTAAGS